MSEAVQVAIVTGITATIPVITGFILQWRATKAQNVKLDRTHDLVRQVADNQPPIEPSP